MIPDDELVMPPWVTVSVASDIVLVESRERVPSFRNPPTLVSPTAPSRSEPCSSRKQFVGILPNNWHSGPLKTKVAGLVAVWLINSDELISVGEPSIVPPL